MIIMSMQNFFDCVMNTGIWVWNVLLISGACSRGGLSRRNGIGSGCGLVGCLG